MRWCVLVVVLAGCNKQDAEHLESIGRKVGERVEAVTPSDPALTRAWDGLTGRGSPTGLVRQRLQSDQPLACTNIEVTSAAPGQVKLTGEVKETRQKLRAVELARETVGVKEVIDEVRVGP